MIRFLSVRYFKRKGWRFVGTVPRKEKSTVLVVGPQSSWKDLLLCIAVKTITRFDVDVMVNNSAWSWKSSLLLRTAGAIKWPGENRIESTDRITAHLKRGSRYSVVFPYNELNAPGSTPCLDFYDIALSTSSSVVLVAIDHRHKVIKFHNPFYLSGFEHRDMSYIAGYYSSYYWYLHDDYKARLLKTQR